MRKLIVCTLLLLVPLFGHGQKIDLLGTESILFWTPEQQQTGYSSIAQLANTRQIKASENVLKLPRALPTWLASSIPIKVMLSSIDDFMQRTRAAGLLVLHDQQIALEKYALGHTQKTSRGYHFLLQNPWSVCFSARQLKMG